VNIESTNRVDNSIDGRIIKVYSGELSLELKRALVIMVMYYNYLTIGNFRVSVSFIKEMEIYTRPGSHQA